MKKNTKKWWLLNVNLILIIILLLSFMLYILYCAYGKRHPKLAAQPLVDPISLRSTITEADLGTINTDGAHVPAARDIKHKLKDKYNNLNISDIDISNITQWDATITAKDKSTYKGKILIKYVINRTMTDGSISLRVRLFYQETDYWCGPATLQMIVDYFTDKVISQQELSAQMYTENYHGTYPEYMVKSLNEIATPNKRRYVNKRLRQNFGDNINEQKIFYQDVKNSLAHNFPVALAIFGKYPWSGYMRHYVVIYGILVARNFENYKYLILDPTLGKLDIEQSQIHNLFSLENNGRISIYQ
ncbi:hypothetical protein S100390_v1c04090 [Spiroplasma sp. NBRC 100390]|uniref:C39 family peptidase n=1 Tax=unclassified Spiroplasma TaxID=2637901 RepID=UPI00089295EF|nr:MULTISPECIES: C39 family peptidase [unclassified Spiroplasma]AOX43752.1 hypothetical protein STU14_v1c04090 [Spiroplasma sp. TU-14]APE13222.1 hypothetical protein S100390_v1c04090 [Spiroplasma sp. NBRC 100390]